MTAPDIVSVDETNFEYQVVAYSQDVPVLVDFWAAWSDASQRISPLLENLARKTGGSFRLAKLNVDENKKITNRYQVNTVPTLAVFENGQITHQMVGSKSNHQVISFVNRTIPGPGNLQLEKAAAQYQKGDFAAVEEICLEILDEHPETPKAHLLLLKSLIRQGRILDAKITLDEFPPSPEYQQAERLVPLVNALFTHQELEFESDFPGKAVYYRALQLFSRGNLFAALDGFLSLLQENKQHRDGETREIILGILELMDPGDDDTKMYRNRLANILF